MLGSGGIDKRSAVTAGMSRRGLLRGTTGLAAATALAGASAHAAARNRAGPSPEWRRAWFVAMQRPDDFTNFPDTTKVFRDQTIRQRLRPTLSGSAVRVWISNEYGTRPLRIGAGSIGRAGEKQQVQPGTLRPLTFSGEPAIDIPAGVSVISDPVDLAVTALEMLAVSLYQPGSTGDETITVHEDGRQTGYISTGGDHCQEADFAVADTFQARFFLSGVDVLTASDPKLIVTIGDSLTDGYPAAFDSDARYPDLLARKLHDRGHDMGVLNLGISGGRILRRWNGPGILERFDRDVASIRGAYALVVLAGINDLGAPGLNVRPAEMPSFTDLRAGLHQVARRAQAAGILAVGGTLTPSDGATAFFPGYSGPAVEALRVQINDWIRTSRAFDRVADFDAALRDPARPNRMLPAYDCGDHLHLSIAGNNAVADVVMQTLAL